MRLGELFARAGGFVAWMFGRARPFEIPEEPRRNRLYELGREGFLGGGLDWSQAEHKVELLEFNEETLVEVVETEEVFVSYDKDSGRLEGLLDVKEFRSDGVVFVDGEGREQFFEYETVADDEEVTGVYDRSDS